MPFHHRLALGAGVVGSQPKNNSTLIQRRTAREAMVQKESHDGLQEDANIHMVPLYDQ